MHDGVEAVVDVVDPGERLEDLPGVGEVHPHERGGGGVRVRCAVQRDHPVPVVGEVRDDVAAELSAASGDGDGRHAAS